MRLSCSSLHASSARRRGRATGAFATPRQLSDTQAVGPKRSVQSGRSKAVGPWDPVTSALAAVTCRHRGSACPWPESELDSSPFPVTGCCGVGDTTSNFQRSAPAACGAVSPSSGAGMPCSRPPSSIARRQQGLALLRGDMSNSRARKQALLLCSNCDLAPWAHDTVRGAARSSPPAQEVAVNGVPPSKFPPSCGLASTSGRCSHAHHTDRVRVSTVVSIHQIPCPLPVERSCRAPEEVS
jgi:hypothetical protein